MPSMKISIAILSCLTFFACAGVQLSPKQQARLDKLECQAAALAPLVEPFYDAAELIRKARSGEANLNQVLRTLEATEGEVQALLARLAECEEPAPAPALTEG